MGNVLKERLDDPILGLDETYEPFDLGDDDVVWRTGASFCTDRLPEGVVVAPSEADAVAIRAHGTSIATAVETTLGWALGYARECHLRRVLLVDADLNVLKEWPL